MDACMGYLHEADVMLESYIELPLFRDIFEAADPEVGIATAKNVVTEDKTTSLLQKAIAVVRNIFKKIGEMIHTIFTWLGMSKDEKTQYEVFVKKCKSDPEFAGKKITIHDYRAINAEYERTLSKYEKQYRGWKDTEAEERPDLIKDVQEDITKLGKKAASIATTEGAVVTVETALVYAKSSRENAAKIEMMIKYDQGLLDELEKQLGKREIKKFKRKVKHLSSKIKFVRYLAGGRQDQVKTIKESLKETLSNIGTQVKVARHNDDAKGIVKDMAPDVAKGTIEQRKYYKDSYKKMQNDLDFYHDAVAATKKAESNKD